jgi:hypothetical protein
MSTSLCRFTDDKCFFFFERHKTSSKKIDLRTKSVLKQHTMSIEISKDVFSYLYTKITIFFLNIL